MPAKLSILKFAAGAGCHMSLDVTALVACWGASDSTGVVRLLTVDFPSLDKTC